MRSRVRFAMLATSGVLAAGAFAACGDDDDEDTESAAAPAEVALTADEYSFELSENPGPETKKVTVENVGEEPHAMIFARINEGFTLEEANDLQGRKGSAEIVADEVEVGPGETKSSGVGGPLTPGNYGMLCPLSTEDGESHFELGQRLEFTIE